MFRVVADLDNWKALLNIFKAADKASSPIEAVKSIGKSASVTVRQASASLCPVYTSDLYPIMLWIRCCTLTHKHIICYHAFRRAMCQETASATC